MILSATRFREYFVGFLNINDQLQKRFKYSIISDVERQWSMPTKNLISGASAMVIKTSWNLPFEINRQVILNGDRYKIVRCSKHKAELNEQAAQMWKNNGFYWILEVAA